MEPSRPTVPCRRRWLSRWNGVVRPAERTFWLRAANFPSYWDFATGPTCSIGSWPKTAECCTSRAPSRRPALGPPPSPEFVATLRRRGVEPCSTGHVVVATRQPHETVVLQTIRDLGLELQVIFNKGAVMVLPSGINKATGLAAALAQLKIDAHCVVAVGDGENDHALLESCGLGIAVANAVPLLKAHADWVTDGASSEGVQQLIARLLENDLADLHAKVHGAVAHPVSS